MIRRPMMGGTNIDPQTASMMANAFQQWQQQQGGTGGYGYMYAPDTMQEELDDQYRKVMQWRSKTAPLLMVSSKDYDKWKQ